MSFVKNIKGHRGEYIFTELITELTENKRRCYSFNCIYVGSDYLQWISGKVLTS